MRITYKKGDPRAGMTAEVPSEVGKKLIESGAAVEVKANTPGSKATPSEEQQAIVRAATKPGKKAAKPGAKGK